MTKKNHGPRTRGHRFVRIAEHAASAKTAASKPASGSKPQPEPAEEPAGRNSYRVIVRSNKEIGNYTPAIFEERVLQSNDIAEAQSIADAAREKA